VDETVTDRDLVRVALEDRLGGLDVATGEGDLEYVGDIL